MNKGLELTKLPKEMIEGVAVQKITLTEMGDWTYLYVLPRTTIKMHRHEEGQWEACIVLSEKTVYICLAGEEHEVVNDCEEPMTLMEIQGKGKYSYEDLKWFFYSFGYSVKHGSIITGRNATS